MKRKRLWRLFEVLIFLALLAMPAMLASYGISKYWGSICELVAVGFGLLAVALVATAEIVHWYARRR